MVVRHLPGLTQGQEVIRPLETPLKPSGHIQILRGNLAPEGAVAKITGKEGLTFTGPARVFDSEEEAAFARGTLDPILMRGLEDAGWVNFGFAAGGFAMLMSNTPIRKFDDLKGKKVWIPEGDSISRAAMAKKCWRFSQSTGFEPTRRR